MAPFSARKAKTSIVVAVTVTGTLEKETKIGAGRGPEKQEKKEQTKKKGVVALGGKDAEDMNLYMITRGIMAVKEALEEVEVWIGYIPSRGREKSYEVDDHYRSAHYSTHGENYIRRGLSPDNVHRAGHTGRSRRDIRDYASSDPYGYYNGDTERVSREFGREQIVANEYSFRDSKEYSTVTGYPAYKNFDSYKESDTSRATDPSPFSKNIRPGELLPYHNSMQGASDNKNEYSSINNYDRSQFLDVPPAKSAYDNYYDQSTSKSHSSLQPYSSYGTSIGAGNPPSRQAQQLPVQRHPPPTALYPPTTSYPRPSASGYQVPGGSSHYRTSALDMSKMTYRPYKPY
ncbi:uncharacterized protein LOC135121430 isoform X1 [Zophobas morio]|uniref:uncharacterized protein LOC135121430 isoform X1 n=1 Tax=Zophobas morio TaxID=2755281 RepID=UPI003083B256